MKKYQDNQDIKRAIKAFLIEQGIPHQTVADALGMSQQSFSMLLSKKNITPADIKKILDVIGYDFYFDFLPKE